MNIGRMKNNMGMYDTVLVPCPKCGELYQAQSKSGKCNLDMFQFGEAPDDVMVNINRHAPFECSCGTFFMVDLKDSPTVVETENIQEEFEPLPENASVDDYVEAFMNYIKKLDDK